MKASIVTLLLVLAVGSPSMAADLKDELAAIEKSAWKAWFDHDAKAYADLMTIDAIQVGSTGNIMIGREKILAAQAKETCKLKSVDLAEPLGPISARKSPSCNSRSTSSKATTSNPSRLKRLLTLRTRTIASDISSPSY